MQLSSCRAYRDSPWSSILHNSQEDFSSHRLPLSSHPFSTFLKDGAHTRTIRRTSFNPYFLAKSSSFFLVSRIPYSSMQWGRRLWTLNLSVHQRLSARNSFPLLVSVSCFGTFFSSSPRWLSSSSSSFSTVANHSLEQKSDLQLSHDVDTSSRANDVPYHDQISVVTGPDEKSSYEPAQGDKHKQKETHDSGSSNCLPSHSLDPQDHLPFPSLDHAPPLHSFASSSLPSTVEKCRMKLKECQTSFDNAQSKNSELHCSAASRWAHLCASHSSPKTGSCSPSDNTGATPSGGAFTSSSSSMSETCSEDNFPFFAQEDRCNPAFISPTSSASKASDPLSSFPFSNYSSIRTNESNIEAHRCSRISLCFHRSFGAFGSFTGFLSSRRSPLSIEKEKYEKADGEDSDANRNYGYLKSNFYPSQNTVCRTREGDARHLSHEIDEERNKSDRNEDSESEENNGRKTTWRTGVEKHREAISAFHAAQLSNGKAWSHSSLRTPEYGYDTKRSSFHNGLPPKEAPQGSSYFACMKSSKDSDMGVSRRSSTPSPLRRSEMTARAMHIMTTQYYWAYEHWDQWHAFSVECQKKINSLRYYLWRLDLYAFHQVNAVLQRFLLLIFLFMLWFWQTSSSFSISSFESDCDGDDKLKNLYDRQVGKRLFLEKVRLRWDNLTDLPLVSAEEYQRCRKITKNSLPSSSGKSIPNEIKYIPTSPAVTAKINSSSDDVESEKKRKEKKKNEKK